MNKDFGFIFWIHLLLIVASYLSFLYIDWKIILIVLLLLQGYYLLRGGCDLTFLEFGDDTRVTFVWYYLRKVFPSLHQKKTKIFVRYFIPLLILGLAFVLQEVFGYKSVLSL
jgi:hypothetical protein